MLKSCRHKFITLMLSWLLVSSTTYAFDIPEEVYKLEPNIHAQINSRAQRTLSKAWSDFEEERIEIALSQLQRIVNENKNNPVAVSYALQSASQILAHQERYKQSIKLILEVLRLKSLNKSSLSQQELLLAQLYIQEGQFEQASNSLLKLTSSLKADNRENKTKLREWYYLLSYCQFQLNQFTDSIKYSDKALKLGHPKNEEIYQLQLNASLALKDFTSSQKISKILINLNPDNKIYWQQWVRIALQLNDSKAALSGLELLKKKYALSPDETLHHAQLLLQNGSPSRAAKLLQHAWDSEKIERNGANLRLLAFSWEQAGQREHAIEAFNTSQFIQNYHDSLDNIENLKFMTHLLVRQETWHNIVTIIDKLTDNAIENWLNKKDVNSAFREEKLRIALEYGRALFHLEKTGRAKQVFAMLKEQLIQSKQKSKAHTELNTQLDQWNNYFKLLDKQSSKT